MVDSQMGIEESLANPANLVKLEISCEYFEFPPKLPQKSSTSSALAGVGPSTLQPSKTL
jgi:hypothetical protein